MSRHAKLLIMALIFLAVSLMLSACTAGMNRRVYTAPKSFADTDFPLSLELHVIYDPDTKVCYLYADGAYRISLCPYYIVNASGKAEVAVYGVNYPQAVDDSNRMRENDINAQGLLRGE